FTFEVVVAGDLGSAVDELFVLLVAEPTGGVELDVLLLGFFARQFLSFLERGQHLIDAEARPVDERLDHGPSGGLVVLVPGELVHVPVEQAMPSLRPRGGRQGGALDGEPGCGRTALQRSRRLGAATLVARLTEPRASNAQ